MGILAADNNLWLMLALIAAGALVLVWFFAWVRAKERAGKEPLLSAGLFRNRVSNLGLITQNGPMADADGRVVRGLGLPAGRASLRRHPDRGDLHRRHGRPAGVLARRRASCEAVPRGHRSSIRPSPSGRRKPPARRLPTFQGLGRITAVIGSAQCW